MTCLLPIIFALLGASEYLGYKENRWQSCNTIQEKVINQYLPQGSSIHELKEKYFLKQLCYIATNDSLKLKSFLQKHNSNLDVQDFSPNEFGVATILTLQLKWLYGATQVEIVKNNQIYPAIEIKNSGFSTFKVNNEIISKLKTDNGDEVCIKEAGNVLHGLDLVEYLSDLETKMVVSDESYSHIVFPMVDFEFLDDDWLKGMRLGAHVVTRSYNMVRYKMHHFGINLKSIAVINMTKSIFFDLEKKLIIDKPFYIWIKRPNISIPIFSAYVSEKNWKNPINVCL